MKYLRLLTTAVATALLLPPLLSSCSSELEAAGDSGQSSEGVINIFATDNTDTETRAAVTSVTKTTENSINRVAVGVFNSRGEIVGKVEETEISGTPVSTTVKAQYLDQAGEGAQVLVAVNCPKGTFSNINNSSAFNNHFISADEALCKGVNGSIASNNSLPMYGQARTAYNGTKQLSADVFVYHIVSKVTLTSLKVNLPNGDTFTPSEIFLCNVPEVCRGTQVSNMKDYQFPSFSTDNVLTGESSISTTKHRDYLTTGTKTFTGTKSNNVTTYSSGLPVFYTTPSNHTDTGEGGAEFLVIKGKYYVNGQTTALTPTGGSTTDMYYTLYLNYNTVTGKAADGRTLKCVYPNTNYKVDVTLTGYGTASPYLPVNESSATVNVNAVSFTNQTVTENYNYVRIGEYLYNDGTWGPIPTNTSYITAAHHPVAVIFSNTTSKIDQAHGWTHGYAIALASCGAEVPWTTSSAAAYNSRVISESTLRSWGNLPSSITSPMTDWTGKNVYGATVASNVLSDIDGYTETQVMMNFAGSNAKGQYPAAWYASNFGTSDVGITVNPTVVDQASAAQEGTLGTTTGYAITGTNTSGWYLGSIGQYYLAQMNLGSFFIDDFGDFETIKESNGWSFEPSDAGNVTSLNTFITKGQSSYAPGVQFIQDDDNSTMYCTSSEYSSTDNFDIEWGNTQSFGLFITYETKTSGSSVVSNRGVRPVIAF